MKKIIFMFCSLLPLCLQIPYLLSAWRFSRLDQWDALFYLLAVPAAAYAVRKAEISHWDRRALFPAVPLLLLALGTPWHQTHALAIAASALFIFTAVWLAASWSFAYRLLPAILILLLGTPSSSYALSCLLMCPVWAAWAVKFLLSALCFLWIFCNERFGLQLKTGTLCFGAAFLCSA
ncbi:MAG: hypothetical protein J6S21_02080, partial [Victivallales bacterium]|nr:hypothetical protein [Victivallales bacterium]